MPSRCRRAWAREKGPVGGERLADAAQGGTGERSSSVDGWTSQGSCSDIGLKAPMMLRAVCVLALVAGCALRIEAQPSQPELVERAGAYVTRFLAAFSNVIAEERYEQES